MNEELKKAAEEYAYKGIPEEWKLSLKSVGDEIIKHFIAGAEWQKNQMLKEAEECELYWDGDFLAIDLNMAALGYSERDKVRIIILKEEEK